MQACLLAGVYSRDVLFIDLDYRVEGLSALTEYSARMYESVAQIGFRFEEVTAGYGRALLRWEVTLRKWREEFSANLPRVRALGYPESFIRMWEFYLCYCEGAFLESNIGNVQMLLAKPLNRRASLGYA